MSSLTALANMLERFEHADRMPGHVDYMSKKDMQNVASYVEKQLRERITS